MKKTLIAAGVAVAMAAPVAATADVSLTAQIQTEIVNLSGDGRANGNGWYITDAMSGGMNSGNWSRVDFRASQDLGNGLTALGHIGVNLNVNQGVFNNAARELTAGLRGDFGTVRVGRLTGAYFTSNKDPFHGTFLQARGNGGMLGGFGGLGNGGYIDQAIDYRGSFDMLSFAATFGLDSSADATSDDTKGENMYALRLNLNFDPVEVWVAHTNADEYGLGPQPGNNDFSAWKVGAEFSTGPFGVMAQYEDISHEDQNGNDLGQAGQYAMVAGSYTMGANRFMLGYGQFDGETDNDARWIALGMRHSFTRQVSVHAGVRQTQYNDNDDKETAIGAGMRVTF